MKTKMGWLLLSCLMVLALVLVSCKPEGPAKLTPKEEKQWEWPDSLIIGTPAVGTGSHAMTSALAPILEKDTGMKVRVIPEDVESVRYKKLIEGKFDIASLSVSEMEMAIVGLGGYADKARYPVRILWHQNDTPWMFAAPGNSDLKTIYDIKKRKGIKIAINTASPAMTTTVKDGLLGFLGISEDDVTFVPFGGYSESVRGIVEGKAEVALISPMSAVTHEIAASPIGVKWLDMPLTDKEGWKRFMPHRPTAIPAKITWGVESAIGHYGYTSNYLYWVRADTDPELVYHLAKWFHEKFDSYKDAHAACARMDIDIFRSFLDYCPAPVHDQTVKYLKEIGKWTAKDDEWNSDAAAMVDKYCNVWNAATAEASSKGITISADNDQWLEVWSSYKKDLPRLVSRIE